MAGRKSSAFYDEDDLDDGYSDEDYWDEEEGDDPSDAPVAVKPVVSSARPDRGPTSPVMAPIPLSQAKPGPTSAKGASLLAQTLAAPPLKPKKKADGGAKQPQPQPKKPAAPPKGSAPAAPPIKPFAFDTPSPDDAVRAAQAHRGGGGAAAATAAVAGISLNDEPSAAPAAPPYPRHRPLSEYSPDPTLAAACAAAAAADAHPDAKPRLHLVVLGHVDAGKSTLMGRMLYDLGRVEERAVHRAQRDAAAAGKASFAWAWMLDERPEERARGVTVDVAVSRFDTAGRAVTLLDAPGHRDFVPNMIAGAAQADAALLVVDGSPGGFEAGFAAPAPGSPEGGGQTREHAQLARSLGVDQAAVVVTKLDTAPDPESRFAEIRAQLEPYLRSVGFKAEGLQWLPAVGPTGQNLTAPPTDPALASWFRGPTLAAAIDAFAPPHRLTDRPLRLPVAEVAAKGSRGAVVVSGKVEGGALAPGTRVLVLPSREEAVVKAVEVDGRPAALARAGDAVDVTLTGVEPSGVHAGYVVCHPDFPVPLAASFEAEVVVLDVAIPILKGQAVTLHAHAARDSGHVGRLIALLDGKTGEVVRERPRCLLKGQAARVEVAPARPMPLEAYADFRALGRVALRDGGRTIAVGIVTAVHRHHHYGGSH